MSAKVVPIKRPPRKRRGPADTVPVTCQRPSCDVRFEIDLSKGGRRREYCTSTCQELANIEKRKALAKLRVYEQETAKVRAEYERFEVGRSELSAKDARCLLDVALAESIVALEFATPAESALARRLSTLVTAANAYLESQP